MFFFILCGIFGLNSVGFLIAAAATPGDMAIVRANTAKNSAIIALICLVIGILSTG